MSRQLDVLFIHSGSSQIYQNLHKQYSAIEVPVWSLLLANSIRYQGYGTEILDCDALNLTNEEAVKEIKGRNPRLVVFVVYGSEPNQGTTRMASAVPLAEKLKESYPEYKICFSGSHTQALPKEVLALKCVDFVLLNEGVYALRNLLECLRGGNDANLWQVKGIGWKPWGNDKGYPVLNDPEQIVPQDKMDDDLPGYSWGLLPGERWELYRSHFWHAGYDHTKRSPFASIYTSLGCPWRCQFCMINSINRTDNSDHITAADSAMFRYWTPEHTLQKIEILVKAGVTTIRFSDEMFLLRPAHYEPILQGIKERWGDKLNLWAYARVDTVKEKFLHLLRSAGFRWLALGIESGVKNIRKDASKGSFQDVDVIKVVRQIEDADIDVISNFIVGLEHDTYESMQRTKDLAFELNTRMMNVYPAQALPGSPLYAKAKREGKTLPSTYSGYGFLSYDCQPLGTETLTPADVVRFRDEMFCDYWSRGVFHAKVKEKFGQVAVDNIQGMLKVKLKRRLLGD